MTGEILWRGEDVKSQQDCRLAVSTDRASASSVPAEAEEASITRSEAEEASIPVLSKHVANETSGLVQATKSSATPSNVTLASMQLDAGQGAGDIEIKERVIGSLPFQAKLACKGIPVFTGFKIEDPSG